MKKFSFDILVVQFILSLLIGSALCASDESAAGAGDQHYHSVSTTSTVTSEDVTSVRSDATISGIPRVLKKKTKAAAKERKVPKSTKKPKVPKSAKKVSKSRKGGLAVALDLATTSPSSQSSSQSSSRSSYQPSMSSHPSFHPFSKPSMSSQPSSQPSFQPSMSSQPSFQPSYQLSSQPTDECAAAGISDQMDVLLALKDGFDNGDTRLSDWINTTEPCCFGDNSNWGTRISCSSGEVTQINLRKCNMFLRHRILQTIQNE